MKYFDEILGFSGQVAIICSIIAAIICLILIPQNIREKIIFWFHKYRRALIFVISGKTDKNDNFIIWGYKRNEKIINKYFELRYDKIYIKVFDLRKYKIIKNVISNKQLKKQKMLKVILQKISVQRETFINAVECLLIDKSAINSETYRKKYSYNKLLISIMNYVISEHNEENFFKVKFTYIKTSKNGLPSDIELKLYFDNYFLRKYYSKIGELYFDESKLKQYAIDYNLKDVDINFLYDAVNFYKRNNMDIYDLDVDDYIKYVAPRFYVFISNISDGNWIYSKLNRNQYQIDHFEFDLECLYKLCDEHVLMS